MNRNLAVVLCVLAASCTDDGAPAGDQTVAFDASPCKGHGAPLVYEPRTLDTSPYDGLECIVWERLAGGNLDLVFANFSAGCDLMWEGSTSLLDDGTLEVRVTASGGGAMCGSCIYDWAFEIADVPDDSLPVQLIVASQGGSESVTEATIEVGASPGGAICSGYVQTEGPCGGLFGSCAGDCEGEPCDGDLGCSEATGVCHAPCETAADCSLPDVLGCVDDLCVLPD